jgi:acyl-CoA-binding protein
MDLNHEFQQATEKVQMLQNRPSNETLLKLYALYKQATEGNIKRERPAGFDFKAVAKYDAWAALHDKAPDECKKEYIDLVNSLVGS